MADTLSDRLLRVALYGYVFDDDPTVIADAQAKIEALAALLMVHRCNAARAGEGVGDCVKSGACGCSAGLLLKDLGEIK